MIKGRKNRMLKGPVRARGAKKKAVEKAKPKGK